MTVLSRNYTAFRIPESEKIPLISTNGFIDLNSYFGLERGRDTAISVTYLNEISKENREIINQINSFENLDDNWDGLNAKKVSNVSIEQAKTIVQKLNSFGLNVYLTSPGPNEEIMLLLESNSKEIEIIIYPHKQKFVQFENNQFVEQGNFDLERIFSLSKWLE